MWKRSRLTTSLSSARVSRSIDRIRNADFALTYSRFDEVTKASAHDEHLASIAPHRRGAVYRVPGEFVIASGRRP
jgi:hypothetical protein